MTNFIHRYPIESKGKTVLELDCQFYPLHIGPDIHGGVSLWVAENPKRNKIKAGVILCYTGEECPDILDYPHFSTFNINEFTIHAFLEDV